jgi:hypothetical protein
MIVCVHRVLACDRLHVVDMQMASSVALSREMKTEQITSCGVYGLSFSVPTAGCRSLTLAVKSS